MITAVNMPAPSDQLDRLGLFDVPIAFTSANFLRSASHHHPV